MESEAVLNGYINADQQLPREIKATNVLNVILTEEEIEEAVAKAKVSVSADKETAKKGDEVAFTVVVNQTEKDLAINNATLKIVVPEGLKLNEGSVVNSGDTAVVSIDGNEITLTIESLKDEVKVEFTTDVEMEDRGTLTVPATISSPDLAKSKTGSAKVKISKTINGGGSSEPTTGDDEPTEPTNPTDEPTNPSDEPGTTGGNTSGSETSENTTTNSGNATNEGSSNEPTTLVEKTGVQTGVRVVAPIVVSLIALVSVVGGVILLKKRND